MTEATKAALEIAEEDQDDYFDRLEADKDMIEATIQTRDYGTQVKQEAFTKPFAKALQRTPSDLGKLDKEKKLPAMTPKTRDILLMKLARQARVA